MLYLSKHSDQLGVFHFRKSFECSTKRQLTSAKILISHVDCDPLDFVYFMNFINALRTLATSRRAAAAWGINGGRSGSGSERGKRGDGGPRLILITSLNLIPYDKWYKSTTLESPAIRCDAMLPHLPVAETAAVLCGGGGVFADASEHAGGRTEGRTDMGISFTRGGIMFWWWHVFLHTKYANAKKRKIFMKLPQNSQANVVKSWKIRFFLCYTQERGSFHPQNNTSDQITMLARRSSQSSHPRGWWVQETERWWLWEGSAGGATEAEIFILR